MSLNNTEVNGEKVVDLENVNLTKREASDSCQWNNNMNTM